MMHLFRLCTRCSLLRYSTKDSARILFNSFAKKRVVKAQRIVRVKHHSTNTEFSDGSTVDEDEIRKLSKSASDWWDVYGEFHALHAMNRVRIPYIKNAILSYADADSISSSTSALPLRDVNILDIGCGGGILSEALARLGAMVTGIDASARNIHVAMRHASHDPLLSNRLRYQCTTAQDLADQGHEFDCIVSSEVIEHVTEKESFISAISSLLKPKGSVVMTTLGQTTKSYLAAIIVAEYLTRMITPGTHDWTKFITADDLKDMLQIYNLETVNIQGLCYNPVTYGWSLIDDPSVNYALHAVKTFQNTSDDTEDTQMGT